jgi:succinoglycan biosynthesis protein ExoA
MGQPVRILHLRASNFVGGPEKQLLTHAKLEHGGSFEVVLGTFVGKSEGRQYLAAIEKQGILSLALPDNVFGRDNAASVLVRALREQNIALLCAHGYKADLLSALAARRAGIPAAWFLRGWTREDWKVSAYEALDRLCLSLATRVVCLSETHGKELSLRRALRHKVRVVANAVKVPDISPEQRAAARHELRARFNIPVDASIVAIAGRLSPEKGATFFLQAIPEIIRGHSLTHFIVFGDGVMKSRLVDLASELGVSAQVHFAGFRADFRELLPGVDILVNPSLSEQMPNVVMEGMAAELPIVATAVGAVSELAGEDKTIKLIPPGKSLAIAQEVLDLLKRPEQAAVLARSARRRMQQTFSFARQQEAFHALYAELLAGSRPENAESVPDNLPVQPVAGHSLQDSSFPFISVVIPVRNEEKHLGAVLEGLLGQDYPADRFEIVVVDGNSTDGTASMVEETAKRSATRIKLLPNPGQLSSAGRNVGVRQSSGEVIVFVDGHCHIPSREFLLDTARYFQTTGAECLCRPQPLTAPGSNWFQRVVADVRASLIGHGLDSTIYSSKLEGFVDPTSSGASYRREVFDRVGLYDERLDACEDVEFNHRVLHAGLRAYISPRLTVHYHARSSLSGLWKQMVRYGRGRYRFNRKHPQAFSITQVIPALFLLWLLFGSVGGVISARIAQMLLWSAGVYGAVIVASSITLGLRRGWRHAITAPSVYLTIHFGLGYGFLAELAHALWRKIWSRHPEAGENSPVFHDASARCNSTTSCGQVPHVQTATSAVGDLPLTPADKFQPINAFTVDVEDYFHTEAMASVVSREAWEHMPSRVQDSTRRLFELLGNHDVRGTFFFLGWVAERFPRLVREALELGHEVGCHSFWHRPVHRLTPSEFREDTLRAKRAIEDAGGVRVRGYRAPSFTMVPGTEWALAILAELGFDYDSSVHPVSHDLYSNASAPRVPNRVSGGAILELPIATTRLGNKNLPIGGGGYLRILPYAYSRWGLRRSNHVEGLRGIVYLHPWEIDSEQPRLQAPRKARFRQYVGLSTMERKLDSLLQDFRFAPISSVFQQELLETAPVTRAAASPKHVETLSGRGSQQVASSVVPLGGG